MRLSPIPIGDPFTAHRIQVELPVEGGIEARIGRVRLGAGGGPPGREESLEALGLTTGGVDSDP